MLKITKDGAAECFLRFWSLNIFHCYTGDGKRKIASCPCLVEM